MPTYYVELVDAVSQLFITGGWVYVLDSDRNSDYQHTDTGGPTIGRATLNLPGNVGWCTSGKKANGVELYEEQVLRGLSIAPVVNQIWLTPLGQPETPYVCPFGDGLSFNTQAELEAHVIAAHPSATFVCPYNDGYTFFTQAELDYHIQQMHPPEPEPEPDPTPGKSIPAQVFASYPTLLRTLWLMREKVFSREMHIKLHPLI